MRFVSRIDGKRRVFKNKKEYDAFLDDLKERGVMKDRSRKARPGIQRSQAWKNAHHPLRIPPRRFNRSDVEPVRSKQKISVIQPSRGRPAPCRQSMCMWIDHCSPHNELEYVLSLDSDNSKDYLSVIKEMLGQTNLKIVIKDNKTMVEALNNGAKEASGDILLYISDDFECMPNWDVEIQKAVKDRGDDWVLFVNDGIQQRTQTISILSRVYYSRFGYIYHPGYMSMWADPDFTEVARRLKKNVNAMHLTFKHNHFTVGGLPCDGTYQKQNSPEAWAHGEKLYYERAGRNFDV